MNEENKKNFTVNKKEFYSAIEMSSHAVAKKTTNPILSGIKIEVFEKYVHIYATDLQTGFHKIIEIKENISENFSFVVGQKVLSDIVQYLPENEIKIIYEGNLLIQSGNSDFKIPTMDSEDFPQVIPNVLGESISLEKKAVLKLIEKVIFCALKDSDPISRNLNGVYWDFREGGYLTLVASDSYRLALSELNIGESDISSFLLSLKSMEELKVVLQMTSTEKVNLNFDGSRVLFSFEEDNLKLVLNVVDAKFPNYPQIIPDAFKIKIKADTNSFINTLKRVSIASGRSEQIKFIIEDDTLLMTANSSDVGEAKENITVDKDGEDLTIAYSPRFLREAVDKIETSVFEFNISGEQDPTIIKPIEDNSYMYIVMPTRINDD